MPLFESVQLNEDERAQLSGITANMNELAAKVSSILDPHLDRQGVRTVGVSFSNGLMTFSVASTQGSIGDLAVGQKGGGYYIDPPGICVAAD